MCVSTEHQQWLLLTKREALLRLMKSSRLGTHTMLPQTSAAAGSLFVCRTDVQSVLARPGNPNGNLQAAENTKELSQRSLSQRHSCAQRQVFERHGAQVSNCCFQEEKRRKENPRPRSCISHERQEGKDERHANTVIHFILLHSWGKASMIG